MQATESTKPIRLKGRIYPTEWDEWDNIERVGIEPDGDEEHYEEYLFVDNDISRELHRMLHRIVVVEGTARQDAQGDWQITATSWSR